MKQLFFKSPYLNQIRAGKKTSTIRLSCFLRAGEEVLFLSGHARAKVLITKTQRIKIDSVGDSVAIRDGLRNKQQLMGQLESLHPGEPIDELWVIDFKLLDSYERHKRSKSKNEGYGYDLPDNGRAKDSID